MTSPRGHMKLQIFLKQTIFFIYHGQHLLLWSSVLIDRHEKKLFLIRALSLINLFDYRYQNFADSFTTDLPYKALCFSAIKIEFFAYFL